jgi:hypothetical protein
VTNSLDWTVASMWHTVEVHEVHIRSHTFDWTVLAVRKAKIYGMQHL